MKLLALVGIAGALFGVSARHAAPSSVATPPPIAVLDGGSTSWHGSAVAQVAQSACPSCTLVSSKVLGANEVGDDSKIARALSRAVDRGARVVNLSMAGTGEAPALRAAIRTAVRRGVVIVAAAGNDGAAAKSYPAADPNVIGVAATTAAGRLFAWSNRGSWITVAAPGRALVDGGANWFVGTSAAAPAVSGAAARCLAANPRLSPAAVRRLLVRTAARLPGLAFGRLDSGAFVAACEAA